MDNPIKTYDEINEEFKLYKDEMEEKLRILESIVKLGSFLNSILSKPNFLEIVNNMISTVNEEVNAYFFDKFNKSIEF